MFEFKMLQKILLIVFDFDGVLRRRISEDYPASLFNEAVGKKVISGSKVIFETTDWLSQLASFGIDVTNRMLVAEISYRMLEYKVGEGSLFEWTAWLIPALARQRNLAILTNNTRLAVEGILGELRENFQGVVAHEDVGTLLKPSPFGLQMLCEAQGVKPEHVLMIGDSDDDLLAAKRAGTHYLIAEEGRHVYELLKIWRYLHYVV